jgi:hypothetical protein
MTKDTRINVINIGLMVMSCIAAFIMPFEVFLFAYAVLGPLHYLTEISWLHDRQYFTKGKYDFVILLLIGVLITLMSFSKDLNIDFSFLGDQFSDKIIFLALAGSLLMIFIKNIWIKSAGLLFIFVIANAIFQPGKNDNFTLFIGALIPTLVHVYVFTLLFMLFGALKSRSTSGLLSIVVLVICPLLLIILFQGKTFVNITEYGKASYYAQGNGFFDTNLTFLTHFFDAKIPYIQNAAGQDSVFVVNGEQFLRYDMTPQNASTANLVFNSSNGILLMRFIAFAYTYHYLNWFSKTEIIRWHKVPKIRFIVVIAMWIAALVIYAINYSLGLQVLFFLSFCHVLLEFPLNMTSIVGIGKETRLILKNGFKPVTAK